MALRPITIGLLWHSTSSGNLGVAALTVANIAITREVAAGMGLEPRFVIIGMRDGEQCYIDDPDVCSVVVDTRAMLKPSGIWAVLEGVDCVLDIGGGDSFAEIYGAKRFGFLWSTKIMAVARRKPLLLSPQTIGPFTRQPYKLLARIALERAQAVVARDRKSFDFLRALAPRAKATLATDVAFELPYQDRSGERKENVLRIGLNVSGLLLHDAETGRNRFGLGFDYAALTRRLLTALSERPSVEIYVFAHVAARQVPTDDDGRACDRIAQEFPAVRRVPDFRGPSEAKSFMSGLDFVIAGRMHACIGALSAGVPVVPIAYSRKFSGLFGTLGYDWMVPATGMATEEAAAYVLDCLDRREELKADLNRSLESVSGLLDAYRAQLAELLATAAPR